MILEVFGGQWRRSCGSEVCRSLSQSKVQRQFGAQCTQWSKISILELGMMAEKGEWWEVLEVLRVANNSSQEFVFVFCLYLGFVVLFFKSKYLDFGNSKGLQQSIKYIRSMIEGMGIIFYKDFSSNDWEVNVLFSYLLSCQMAQWCQGNLIMWFVWVWRLWEERLVGSTEWD